MCPTSVYPIPYPNQTVFHSTLQRSLPYVQLGLGTVSEINLKKIIPDENISIKMGGIVPIGDQKTLGFLNN